MQICKIVPEKLRPALELIWEVFEEFEVPDYEEMGIQTFCHFIEYHNFYFKYYHYICHAFSREYPRIIIKLEFWHSI